MSVATLAQPAEPAEPAEPVDQMPLAALESEITTLAGHLAAATCRFLLLLASFDTREGWGGAGMRSCAHWLSWRCGMSLSTAHEHLRVAHAMTDLPVTTAAFSHGTLSYAKARAITRVATPATEVDLVNIAHNAPAAHLDRLVAGLRRATTLADDNVVAAQAEHRHHWNPDGTLAIKVRLSPEDGATYLAALHATRDALDERAPAASPPIQSPEAQSPAGDCEPAGDGEPALAALVAPITLVQAFVAIAETALAHRPAVGPSAARAEVVVHVDLDVLSAPDTPPETALGLARCHVQDGPGIMAQVARALACDAGIVIAVHPRTGRRTINSTVLDVGRRRRRPSPAILRALWIRDQGCVHPGCHRRRRLVAHHVVHWAHGGATALHNLVLLCRYHHSALHRGEIDIRLQPGGRPITTNAAGPITPAPDIAGNATLISTTHDAQITKHTTTPTDWLGDPLHLGYAVNILLDAWARPPIAKLSDVEPSRDELNDVWPPTR